MASPKSVKMGSAVAPMDPTEPEDADVADPGAAMEAKQAKREGGPGKPTKTKAPQHTPPPEDQPPAEKKKSWIEIALEGDDGKPIPGEYYEVKLPDGATVASGTLSDKGEAKVEGIDPGTCYVEFPQLDKDSWEPKG